MDTLHAHNRERAVRLITERNRLQKQMVSMTRHIASVTKSAEAVRSKNARELLVSERQATEVGLCACEIEWTRACAAVEQVKADIQSEEADARAAAAARLRNLSRWNGK